MGLIIYATKKNEYKHIVYILIRLTFYTYINIYIYIYNPELTFIF